MCIRDSMYTDGPDGYCGDEDNGQTSAWYVFSTLGFYPVAPGTGEYAITSPLFKKATIRLENGKTVVINAPDNSSDKRYIGSMKVNGADLDRNFFTRDQLMDGAVIDIVMDSKPNTARGVDKSAAPYSFSNELRATSAGRKLLKSVEKEQSSKKK